MVLVLFASRMLTSAASASATSRNGGDSSQIQNEVSDNDCSQTLCLFHTQLVSRKKKGRTSSPKFIPCHLTALYCSIDSKQSWTLCRRGNDATKLIEAHRPPAIAFLSLRADHPKCLALCADAALLQYSDSFKAARTYQPIHTGGKVALSGDGKWLFSTLNEQALVTDIETGERIQLLKGVRRKKTKALLNSQLTPILFALRIPRM